MYDIVTASAANSASWKPGKVSWDQIVEWIQNPADHKECGGYVLGKFRGKHRRDRDLIHRQVVVLDFDDVKPGDDPRAALRSLGVMGALHTTYSSAPDSVKLRTLVPLDRPVNGEEYELISTALAQRFGAHSVDPTSLRPSQFMWKPATQNPSWYSYDVFDGPAASADDLMLEYDAALAAAMRRGPNRRQLVRKRDPFRLEGLPGAFNRAYNDLDELITEFALPYVKEGTDRYRYEPSKSIAGMGPVADAPGLYYSHHATDPAGLQACSAYDLVRIHLYGDLDTRPGVPVNRLESHKAMLAKLADDVRVKTEALESAQDDFANLDPTLADLDKKADKSTRTWLTKMAFDKTGRPADSAANLWLVSENDEVLLRLAYDVMMESIVVTAPLPWDPEEGRAYPNLTEHDRYMIHARLETSYQLRLTQDRFDMLISFASQARRVNPLREHLLSLKWDGIERLETCLPGVVPTRYTRMVARKSLLGAVARAIDPGCKVDQSMILSGKEGLGKTRWIAAMAIRPSYMAILDRIGSKDTYLTMMRSWIMVSDEVESLKRTDFDVLKSFMTKTHDNFRMPYDREDVQRPRRCVIWGTTNDPKFLRRQEGNRRFLIVRCETVVNEATLDEEYVEQVWAEAVHAYLAGEPVWLDRAEEQLAAQARAEFTKDDPLLGQVQAYLDMDVPSTWEESSPTERAMWFHADRFISSGSQKQDVTCAIAVYREVMGQDRGSMTDRDAARIADALDSAQGWVPAGQRQTVYGLQESYVRVASVDGLDALL